MLIIVAVAGSIRMIFTVATLPDCPCSGRRLDQDAAQRCETLHTRMTTIATWKLLPVRHKGRYSRSRRFGEGKQPPAPDAKPVAPSPRNRGVLHRPDPVAY